MKKYETRKPIGLEAPCREIEDACRDARVYRQCGLRPAHMIIPLDPGEGRTTLLEYMAGEYRKAGVLGFESGLDDYIEVTLDGTLPQLKQAFAEIRSAAVYTNEYRDLIGMDISGIAAHAGETQYDEFLKNCRRICASACVVFFVHTVPTRNEEKLLEKLCEIVDNVRRLAVEPYTADQLCGIIARNVADHGTGIRNEAAFREALAGMVSEFGIASVKDAVAAAESIIRCADFTGFTPVVDEHCLEQAAAGWQKENENGRIDVK